jgi:serine protease Do
MRLRLHSRSLWLASWAVCGATLCAQQPGPANVFDLLQKQVQQEMEKCREAVVRIESTDKHGKVAGTGFFVDPNGLLYTSFTVAGESSDIFVRWDSHKYPARRLAADHRSGIAILKVDAQTAFVPIGRSALLATGSPVMTCGYPMDLPLTPSFGLVGGFDRKYMGRYFATTHLRANLAVQAGEGGAPLLNMKGEAVGILIASVDNAASFALPMEAAEKVRRDLARFGKVRQSWLGLQMETAAEPTLGSTALVQDLFPDSPAQKAGIHVGDSVLEIAGRKIASPEDMIDASFFLIVEDAAPIRLARDGVELTVQVVPGDPPRPPAPAPPPVLGSTGDTGPAQPFELGGK